MDGIEKITGKLHRHTSNSRKSQTEFIEVTNGSVRFSETIQQFKFTNPDGTFELTEEEIKGLVPDYLLRIEKAKKEADRYAEKAARDKNKREEKTLVLNAMHGISDINKFALCVQEAERDYFDMGPIFYDDFLELAVSPEIVLSKYLGLPYTMEESYESLDITSTFIDFNDSYIDRIIWANVQGKILSFDFLMVQAIIKNIRQKNKI